MQGYYLSDGSRVEAVRVAYPLTEAEESVLDAEFIIEDILDVEVVG
jgi:hypothetical protein